MPTIHRPGTKPSDLVWRLRCGCGCVADFAEREVVSCQRERDSWVHCPTCSRVHHVRPNKSPNLAHVRADAPVDAPPGLL
jgi:hypothetical protein